MKHQHSALDHTTAWPHALWNGDHLFFDFQVGMGLMWQDFERGVFWVNGAAFTCSRIPLKHWEYYSPANLHRQVEEAASMLATSSSLQTKGYQLSNYSTVLGAQHPSTTQYTSQSSTPASFAQARATWFYNKHSATLCTTLGPQGHDLQFQAEKISSPSKDADNPLPGLEEWKPESAAWSFKPQPRSLWLC